MNVLILEVTYNICSMSISYKLVKQWYIENIKKQLLGKCLIIKTRKSMIIWILLYMKSSKNY